MYDTTDYAPPTCATLGGVALRIANIAADNLGGFLGGLRYSPQAVIEKVCFRKESVASCNSSPSYLWARLTLGEDGTPVPVIDYGRLPHSVRIPRHPRHAHRVSWPLERADWDGPWCVVSPDLRVSSSTIEEDVDWPLRMGIAIGQRFLIEAIGDCWRCSHEYEEYDSSWAVTLLYLDSPPALTYLPISTPLAAK